MPPDTGGATTGSVHGHLPGAGIRTIVWADASDNGFFVLRNACIGGGV